MKFLERFWHGCGGHCHTDGGGCPIADQLGREPDRRVPFDRGAPLVAASIGVFLAPLALAIVGGHLARRLFAAHAASEAWPVVGMLAGFGAGVIGARFVLKLCRREPDSLAINDDECSRPQSP